MDKQGILDNVEKYSAGQLVEFINKGYVTFNELKKDTNGNFDHKKQLAVKSILLHADDDAWEKAKQTNTIEAVEDYLRKFPEGKYRNDAHKLKKKIEADKRWQNVNKSDIQSLQAFVNDYPYSEHCGEANRLINNIKLRTILPYNRYTLVEEIKEMDTRVFMNVETKRRVIIDKIRFYLEGEKINKNDFIHILKDDHNLFDASTIKQMVDEDLITVQDLCDTDIDKEYIKLMMKKTQPVDVYGIAKIAPPTAINKKSTEVYFWGIPDSGKTCVLAAILSVLESGKIATPSEDKDSQGYGYMMTLANILHPNKVGPLMTGTPEDCFFEMGVDLKEGKIIHPITFIDMAGELIRNMYKYNVNPNDPSINTNILTTMTNILIENRSGNRKIHFFVIEYGAENRLYDKTDNNPGIPQRTYLHGAFQFINDTKIFKKDTDAIFILLTKADKIKGEENKKQQVLNYIDNNYLALKNLLNDICEDNDINGGSIEIIPFSLGDVCFKDYCKFDTQAADNILRIIIKRSASCKKTVFFKFMDIFN